jgi:acetylornithine deacetylase/succinyl-diaminopimelate desuccinylase-like protein
MENIVNYINANRRNYIDQLIEFLKIPSISNNKQNAPDMQRCADFVSAELKRIGMENVSIRPTAGHPIVCGEWLGAPGKPTVLCYGHYDVQPVDPVGLWESPPFDPAIRGENLYARGSADDKGQVFVHFKGVEAYMKNVGRLPVNIKFLIEGEEEIGSENLGKFINDNREMLKADLVVISDSPMYAYNTPSICYGLRGLTYMELEVVGPNKDLHSGSFGGTIHNPIQALTEIIAQLHDRNGKITVKDFYKDVLPLTKKERAAFEKLPHNDRKYVKELGVPRVYGEKNYSTLERVWARPTLECNGIWGGFIGEGAKTVLPAKASAKISMRLVPHQDPDKIAKLFERHIRRMAPKTVKVNVKKLHTGKPAITPIDSPGVHAAVAALERAFGKKPLFTREGGSIPIVVDLQEKLGAPTVLIGFGLPDENSHAPNEHLNLNNFHGGILTSAYFFDELARIS